MSENENEFDADSDSFKNIRDYLEGGEKNREVSIGLLATVIEDKNIGIYTWDRFGRFGLAAQAEQEKILDFLAKIYKYENDPDAYESKEHPLEYLASSPWEDLSHLFGWPDEKIPDFKAIAEKEKAATRPKPKSPSPQEKTAFARKRETYLIIIKSLLDKTEIDYKQRGAAQRIVEIIQEAGLRRDEDTLKKVLDEIKEFLKESQNP